MITQVDDINYIELNRQRIGVPNKYFNSQYKIEFIGEKLILTNKTEKFTYSAFTMTQY